MKEGGHADLQVLDVSPLCGQQLRHDEPEHDEEGVRHTTKAAHGILQRGWDSDPWEPLLLVNYINTNRSYVFEKQ